MTNAKRLRYGIINVQGNTLLEAMVLMLLSTPLLILAVGTLHMTLNINARITQEYHNTNTFLKIRNLMRNAMEDLDSHFLTIPPRIHSAGNITFTNGEINPVRQLEFSHRPATSSDAITNLRLDLSRTQQVMKVTNSENTLEMTICPRFGLAIKSQTHRSFAGLGSAGLIELKLKSILNNLDDSCKLLSLQSVPSMSLPISSQDSTLVHLLIPIERHYTLYVDNMKQLRFLGHAGQQNIENQPIVANILALQLKLAYSTVTGIFNLESLTIYPDHRSNKSILLNHLARQPYFNFLLSKP
jgi:hypothetical protein